MRPSGRSVEQDLTDFLPKSQASDTVPNSLSKGQLIAGNTKAWLRTNTVKEISFSGHTHSNYALTSHTHSNYALTNHTHTEYASKNHTHSQYVTEVDINQMIEDVIDGYVPTIQTMGQVGIITVSSDSFTTITVSSSTSVIILTPLGTQRSIYDVIVLLKVSGTWSKFVTSNMYSGYSISGSGTTITIHTGKEFNQFGSICYVYF